MTGRQAIALALAFLAAGGVQAKSGPVWQVERTADPITGRSSCVVAVHDRAAGLSFTRSGGLYPMVEMNSQFGLLVGVGSGGRIRLPSGDILWRVDALPYRELRAADNPVGDRPDMPADTVAGVTAQALRMSRAMTATATLASGEAARAMLDKMRAGHTLQFRQAAAASVYGMPQESMVLTGQITAKGLHPYPLDASFRAGLAACGIDDRTGAAR
ncbi:hypothetical protein SAMIE_1023640 [Sphingobium amiense]|uniref:Uncharacterized protein n=1 Tax=Sphingobium amiense TaxID=135719 RepID=A0A494W2L3_9SPHN|nr:hypothetical protein [Sphingobium amiense]BBD98863.1 hypothetical protein SAMIE_1023640 [Sphingobium amiense]